MFPGYLEFPASPDDPLLAKWASVRIDGDAVLMTVGLTVDGVAQMNRDLNTTVRYVDDPKDHWQKASETLALRSGDCEDYAILKYATLLHNGLAEDDMRIVLGQIKSIGGNQDHAWLAAKIEGAWRTLDNKFDQLIEPKDYINWLPVAAVSGNGNMVRFGRETVLAEGIGEIL